jgi:hypothetical protein
MEKKLPNKCPFCGGELMVTELHCPQCDTTINGEFSLSPDPFLQLSEEQLSFVLTFIRCEGRFNRMEKELNLSYPTLRNRLNDVVRALGYTPSGGRAARRAAAEASAE